MGTLIVYYYQNQEAQAAGVPTPGKIYVSNWQEIKTVLGEIGKFAYKGRIQSWEVDFRETEVSAYPNDFTTGLEDCGESLLEKLIP